MKPGRAWILNEKAPAAVSLARELDVHPEVASILIRRGLSDPAAAKRFLSPSLDDLESPFAFRDMAKAVERIRRAIASAEKIVVYGDYDVDGVTGSSIVYPVLKRLGANVVVHIPHRVHEGYGLNTTSLEKLVAQGCRLLITVDNGITGIDPIRYLVGAGVDVIVVDHHLPKNQNELPPATALVCAAAGGGGNPDLAACGLAFKLAWALFGNQREALEYLDLASIGTVADVAPVTGDNRILLHHGLARIAATKKPGLRALLEISRVTGVPTYRDIGFSLAPRINAAGRMGSPLDAFRLLTTSDPAEASALAKALDDGNKLRQDAEAAAFGQAQKRVSEEEAAAGRHVIVVESDEWHEGVLGIVAARLVEKFHKPSIVISLREEFGKGSGRSLPSFSLFDTVQEVEGLLEKFGGHAQACGLTIRRDKIGLFRDKLNEAAERRLALGLTPELRVEGEIQPQELNTKFLQDLKRLEPFGPGNRKPFFLTRGMRVKGEVKKRGQDTMVCWLSDAHGRATCEAVGFRKYTRWTEEKTARAIDVVYQPALVEFRGIASIQLELEDWR